MDVIDFTTARIRIALKKFESTGKVADYLLENGNICQQAYSTGNYSTLKRVETSLETNRLHSYIDTQIEFNYDYKILTNYKTRDSNFMFPTILHHYKHGIDPVTAIYYSLQEALFKYNRNNIEYTWIISLFKNHEWLNTLLYAIYTDINSIDYFCKKYYQVSLDSTFIKNKIEELKKRQENLKHFSEVFLLMYEWDNT